MLSVVTTPQCGMRNVRPASSGPRTLQCACGRRGQTALEYAALIAILTGALVTMSIYIKRSIGGRLRGAADTLGEQYAPGGTTSNTTLSIVSDTETKSELQIDQTLPSGEKADVTVTTTTINNDVTTRTGSETVGPLGTDVWK